MALFKTNQYQVLAAIVNRHLYAIAKGEEVDCINNKNAWQIAQKTVNTLIDELCIEFAKDNRLFNETLFRSQCGSLISNQHATMENNSGDK